MADEKVSWPGWTTGRCIGRGSFGTVYEIYREEYGVREKAALKVLSIPQDQNEIENLRMAGMNEESITTQLGERVQDIVREYKMMMGMKNCPNIVHCEDFQVDRQGLGYHISLKMELLVPLIQAMEQGYVHTEAEIIKLGIDLCGALMACQEKSILHRDVKPQNIFLAADGNFKLGDFGIARTADKNTQATVGVGTYNFMAPEVLDSQTYDSRADIYSLGLVLYWLLNQYRGPFLPLPPTALTSDVQERARALRFSGKPIPAPANGSDALKQIVLKACAFQPDARYATAEEMRRDLQALAEGRQPELRVQQEASIPEETDGDLTHRSEDLRQTKETPKPSKKWILPTVAALLLAAAGAAWFLLSGRGSTAPQENTLSVQETTIPTTLPEKTGPHPSGLSFSVRPGTYSQPTLVEIHSDDPNAEIYYYVEGGTNNPQLLDAEEEAPYVQPLSLIHGETTITAYTRKNGKTSEALVGTYSLDYPEVEVTFQEPMIEKIVRAALTTPSTRITNYDCEEIYYLSWYSSSLPLGSQERKDLRIHTLEDLVHFPSLYSIQIDDEPLLTDLSPLLNCPMLQNVSIYNCGSVNLDVLTQLPYLTSLSLDGNGFDLSPLLSLQNLAYIYINDPSLVGQDTLSDILWANRDLYCVLIYGAQLSNHAVLTELENLESLYIYGVETIDPSVLGRLTNLTHLEIRIGPNETASNATLSGLSFLENLTNLDKLTLQLIRDPAELAHIAKLTNLKELDINSCEATKDKKAMQALWEALPNCKINAS